MTYHLKPALDLAANIPSWRQVAISCIKTFDRHPALCDLIVSGFACSLITVAHAANNPQAEGSFSSRFVEWDSSIQPSSTSPELQCIQILQTLFGKMRIPIEWMNQCVHNLNNQPPGSEN